jgi:hypothetical protein
MSNVAVEMQMTWNNRVLWCRNFCEPGSVYLGGESNSVEFPLFRDVKRYEFLRLGTRAEVFLPTGTIELHETEPLSIPILNGVANLKVQRIAPVPKAKAPPFFKIESSEALGIILALVLTVFIAVYISLAAQLSLESSENLEELKVRPITIRWSKMEKPIELIEASQTLPSASSKSRNTPKKISAAKKSEAPGDLLSVLSNQKISSQLQGILASGGQLSHLTQMATGTGGHAGTPSGSGLKEVGTGADSNLGPKIGDVFGNSGRGKGGPGVMGTIGSRASVRVGGLSSGEEKFSAGMDREAIRRVIQEHMREIRSCYERQLQAAPDLYGKVVLQWDIVEHGQVQNALVKQDNLKNNEVTRCLLTHLSQWNFPDPPRDQVGRVSYPFVFTTK